MNKLFLVTASALAFGLPSWVFAQTAAAPSVAPARPASPGLQYDSAFADYKPWREVRPADWRAVNNAVRDAASSMGGHAGHGSMAAPADVKPPTSTEPPMQHGGGHHQHGGAK